MSDLLTAKTIPNDWGRCWSAFILIVAQCVVLSGGACGPGVPESAAPSDAQPAAPSDDQSGGQTGGQPGGQDGGQAAGQAQVASVENLTGGWVVERAAAGTPVWGQASAYVTSAAANQVTFSVTMEDGTSPFLILRRNSNGALVGYWQTSITDFPNPPDQVNWTGSESADHNTLTGTWVADTGATTITLYRALTPDHTCTGVWTRSADGA
ncbi:MAG: hypothetical protein ACPMAQ_04165, partial [Phycisphaerae bacterium]